MSEQMTAAEFREQHKSEAAESEADSDMTAAAFRDKYGQAKDERQLQKNVCKWLDAADVPYFAVPNGQYRRGQRPEPGMQKGVPDLCIPVPGTIHDPAENETTRTGALYIELKQDGTYPRASQRGWLDRLTRLGHVCAVCRSLDEVQELVCWYRSGRLQTDDVWPEQR